MGRKLTILYVVFALMYLAVEVAAALLGAPVPESALILLSFSAFLFSVLYALWLRPKG